MHLTAVGLCLSQPGDIQLRCSAKEETHQLPLRPSPGGYLGRVSGSLGTPRLGGTRHLSISLILTYLMATTERPMYASFLSGLCVQDPQRQTTSLLSYSRTVSDFLTTLLPVAVGKSMRFFD